MRGTWYSICWSPRDYTNANSFIELDGCPRFHYSEDGRIQGLKGCLETAYPNLMVKEIFKTEIFTHTESGDEMPTHYRNGIFLPGMNKAYDTWLQKSFSINQDTLDKIQARAELFQKNMFLEYSSKIIRHDMHSGINTYIPRGLKGLLQKLPEEVIKEYKLQPSLLMLEKGLKHTQQVYQGVYAFTNLVKESVQLDKEEFSLQEALVSYLAVTAYSNKVELIDLPTLEANESLICTAIDNLIRNGLKYNKNKAADKRVVVFFKDNFICVEDNGVGMSAEEFEILSKPYQRGADQTILGTGLGLNICKAIIEEHGYTINVRKLESGTLIRIGPI